MSQLATREQAPMGGNGNGTGRGAIAPAANGTIAYSFDDVWTLAEKVAESRLFPGVQSAPQAFALMMLCQSEGLHPMQALRRYHIIDSEQGPRPTMRADAIQAEFQARGGEIKILKSDATEARASFRHPVLHPEWFEFSVTYAQFEKTGMIMGKYGVKNNWKHHAADMLWARLVSKAVRKIYPGIIAGIYTPEEIEDLAAPRLDPETVARLEAPAPTAPAPAGEVEVPGFAGGGPDGRPYVRVAEEAVAAANEALAARWADLGAAGVVAPPPLDVLALHKNLIFQAINRGLIDGPGPAKRAEAIRLLARLYGERRDWVRGEINTWLAAEEERLAAAAEETPDPGSDPDIDPDGAARREFGPGADG